MIIEKTLTFDAAHFLNDYEGKCKNIHGHTWKVIICINVDISSENRLYKKLSSEFLIDFGDIKKNVVDLFDHKLLNDIININPTAENLASIICLIINEMLINRFKLLNIVKYVIIDLFETETSRCHISTKDAKLWLGSESYIQFIKK